MKKQPSDIARNRKALHDYEVLETYEAGIALTGTEVRSLRDKPLPTDGLLRAYPPRRGVGCTVYIPPYAFINIANPDPTASASCCCTKNEIRKLEQQTKERAWRWYR